MSRNLCRFIFFWFSDRSWFLSHFTQKATEFPKSAKMSKKLGPKPISLAAGCLSGSMSDRPRPARPYWTRTGCPVWRGVHFCDRRSPTMSGLKSRFWPVSRCVEFSGGVRIALWCSAKPDFRQKCIGFRVAVLRKKMRAAR